MYKIEDACSPSLFFFPMSFVPFLCSANTLVTQIFQIEISISSLDVKTQDGGCLSKSLLSFVPFLCSVLLSSSNISDKNHKNLIRKWLQHGMEEDNVEDASSVESLHFSSFSYCHFSLPLLKTSSSNMSDTNLNLNLAATWCRGSNMDNVSLNISSVFI